MKEFIEILKVFVFGIVEGITEWLPVSSTGHIILLDEFLKLDVSEDCISLFTVVIQLGAILAVPILFFDKLWPFSKSKTPVQRRQVLSLWGKVIVGVIPAAVLGFLLDDIIDSHLMTFIVVAAALIVYGIAFILVELWRKGKPSRIESVYDIGYKDALFIGSFQVLSLIPGTSRSGSTILGGMVGGVSRTAASEFSFFMAIPIMLGASGLKVVKFFLDGKSLNQLELVLILLGIVVSFLVSLLVIKFLMNFVKRHDFKIFGYYRIGLGIILLSYYLFRYVIFA